MNKPFVINRLNRRNFLAVSSSAGALMVSGVLAPKHARANAPEPVRDFDGQVGFFVRINPDNSVEIGYPNPELGQGVSTSLPMLVAEELDVNFDAVSVTIMPLSLELDEEGNLSWVHVGQGSGGSTSIPDNFTVLRRAGALARQMLVRATAKAWDVPADEIETEAGILSHTASERSAPYSEFADAAAHQAMPDEDVELTLHEKANFRVVGKPQPMKGLEAIVTGKPLYGMDMDYPGVVHASMQRCPWLDGAVASIDDSAARAVPGVIDVVQIDGPEPGAPFHVLAAGVAVVADTYWAAVKGREALKIEWDKGPNTGESTASLDAQCRDLLAGEGQIIRDDGDYSAAIETADTQVEAIYDVPFLSHAQLEPQNCIVDWRADGCQIIGPTQGPGSAAREVANATGLERVTAAGMVVQVQPTRLGGGFGRRLSQEHMVEGALISKSVGRPVKLIWSREDDMQHDRYRPAGHHHMRAGIDKNGKVSAWTHRLASAYKGYRDAGRAEDQYVGTELYADDYPAGSVPNLRYEFFPVKSAMPRGFWRAPGHSANAFVIQSFVDEVAHAAGRDPLEFQLELLGPARELEYSNHGGPIFNPGRLAHVLRKAAELGNWGAPVPEGQGRGLACHFTFGGYAAQCVDISVDADGELKVLRVAAAVDVGQPVNPNGIRMQMESGINDGLSTALGQKITVSGGRIQEENFDTYQMMRIDQSVPEIETFIVDSDESPAGMGEMGLPPLAPALCNAIFNATGKRIRSLPIGDQLREA